MAFQLLIVLIRGYEELTWNEYTASARSICCILAAYWVQRHPTRIGTGIAVPSHAGIGTGLEGRRCHPLRFYHPALLRLRYEWCQ